MKKKSALLLCLALLAGVFSGCTQNSTRTASSVAYTGTAGSSGVGGALSVSFARNTHQEIRCYSDAAKNELLYDSATSENEPLQFADGQSIWIQTIVPDAQKQKKYIPEGYQIVFYDANNIAHKGELVEVQQSDGTEYFTEIHLSQKDGKPFDYRDIVIEPIGHFKKRTLTLSFTTDDGIQITNDDKNYWVINNEKLKSADLKPGSEGNGYTAEINPLVSYAVSYHFDRDTYYYDTAELDANKLIQAYNDGTWTNDAVVAFKIQDIDSSKPEETFSLQLHKYNYVNFSDGSQNKKITQIDGDGFSSIEDLQGHPFRRGETFSITTSREYEIACSGAEVSSDIINTERVTTITIPEDAKGTAYYITCQEYKGNRLYVSVPDPEKKPSVDVNVLIGGETYDYQDCKKNGWLEIKDGDQVSLTVGRIDDAHVAIRITASNQNGKKPSVTVTQNDTQNGKFTYTFDNDITKIEIDELKGLLFPADPSSYDPEAYQKLNPTYWHNGNELTGGEFIPADEQIVIKIDPEPGYSCDGIDENNQKTVTVTATADFDKQLVLTAKPVPGFILSEENRDELINSWKVGAKEDTFKIRIDGTDINELQLPYFIPAGTKIGFEGEPQTGFRILDGDELKTITVDGNTTIDSLKEEKLFGEELSINLIFEEPFGGDLSAAYLDKSYDSGETFKYYIGDKVELTLMPWNGYKRNEEFTYEGIKAGSFIYQLSRDKFDELRLKENETKTIETDNCFTQVEDAKPSLTIILDKTLGDNFTVTVSTNPDKAEKYEGRKIGDYVLPDFLQGEYRSDPKSVETAKGLVFTVDNFATEQNKVIKCVYTWKNDTSQGSEIAFFTTNGDHFDRTREQLFEEMPKEITVAFSRVTVAAHTAVSLPNAEIELKTVLTGQTIRENDTVDLSETVELFIRPISGFYLSGSGIKNNEYRNTMSYEKYLNEIQKTLAGISALPQSYLPDEIEHAHISLLDKYGNVIPAEQEIENKGETVTLLVTAYEDFYLSIGQKRELEYKQGFSSYTKFLQEKDEVLKGISVIEKPSVTLTVKDELGGTYEYSIPNGMKAAQPVTDSVLRFIPGDRITLHYTCGDGYHIAGTRRTSKSVRIDIPVDAEVLTLDDFKIHVEKDK